MAAPPTEPPIPELITDLADLTRAQRMERALAVLVASGTKSDGKPNLSIRNIAKQFDIPHSTLTDRWHGTPTRKEGHVHELLLTAAQEDVLAEWIKVMGRRGIPMTATLITDHVANIVGHTVGESWVRRFKARHPELKVKWSSTLEKCRAASLNPALVNEYYDMLEDTIESNNISAGNIYNMDEKGIQLGIGQKVKAFVDRDQKDVYSVEDGNRELVTMIETICADGWSMHPSTIYQGMRWDLEWGRNNPCNASISHSPKDWTDQELGEMWIRKDFEPTTAARNVMGGYRLLILDGHNSHCTYGFCKFVANNKIIIICLPSHTTHALQPCDVACFGPLASAWKSEVNAASADYMEITKRNLLVFYAKARERALKKSTIISAFAKTGIWPLNRHVLNPSAFEPSKNTTTEPAQPFPARLPTLLVPIRVQHNNPDPAGLVTENEVRYIIPLPPTLPHTAARVDLHHKNQMLRDMIHLAEVQLEKDFTQMKLMDSENGRLRKRAFAKEKKKTEKKEMTQAHARLMTGEENLDALAEKDFMKQWKEVVKELVPIFKHIRNNISEHEKGIAQATRNAEKARKEQERAAKKVAEAAEKARKKAEREEAAAARKAVHGRGRGGRHGRGGAGRGRGWGQGAESEGEDDHSGSSDAGSSGGQDQHGEIYKEKAVDGPHLPASPTKQNARPRPRPRPRYRMPEAVVDVAKEVEQPEGSRGPQLQIRVAPIEEEARGEAENVTEGENAAETGRRYPKRSNRSNLHFTYGIDG